MGKPKWWVCGGCKSLNDMPASKCYNCRAAKPASPTLIDDQYGEVSSGAARVGITVDLATVGDLIRPDPLETAKGGEIVEAFVEQGESQAEPPGQPTRPPLRDREGGPDWSKPAVSPTSRLREPTPRSISEVGERPWANDPPAPPAVPTTAPPGLPPASPAPASPTPGAGQMPDSPPPPPPGVAPWPPPPRRPDQGVDE